MRPVHGSLPFEVLFTADRLVPQNTLKEGCLVRLCRAYWRTTIAVSTASPTQVPTQHRTSVIYPRFGDATWLTKHRMDTGKILRVNLSTAGITTQRPTLLRAVHRRHGLANKIMYDEVPAGTGPLSPREQAYLRRMDRWTASGVLPGRLHHHLLAVHVHEGPPRGGRPLRRHDRREDWLLWLGRRGSGGCIRPPRIPEHRRRQGGDQGRRLRVGHGHP